MVSHLTESGVGCEIICNNEGGCQTVDPGPTGKVTSLTRRTGWGKVFPMGVGGLDGPWVLHQGGMQWY